ncbi:WbqC family protein [Magnetospirillum sp. SS-4]|uniref:WbqC family protein n=1 Tax=Magnetospirillum sp. SS-4 TaxID=2681465 RepID=UPI00137C7954|nr:WbqC family protein [Magnetospirillum sp. SS-4]CAA7619614.1 conserved hypothetical protein [Magnetospirillum sp. SS-4]
MSGKTVVISQSNYLPWRGFFHMVRSADELILLDSVQYTRRDWRNRNKVKTANGPVWLTIPVQVKGRYVQSVDETAILNDAWVEKHIRTITLAYGRAGAFDAIAPWLFACLRDAAASSNLTTVNAALLRNVCDILGIHTPILRCTDILERSALVQMEPNQRLLELCRARGASTYLSGPAARDYLAPDLFAAIGISVTWMDYTGYPDYPQLWGEFLPHMSIVDLLLNTGADAPRYLEKTR